MHYHTLDNSGAGMTTILTVAKPIMNRNVRNPANMARIRIRSLVA
jgi:hypothetical protein